MGVIPILLFIYSNKPSWRFYFIEVFAVRFYHPNMRYYYDSSLSQLTPLARRHPGFPRKYHRKVVTVLKAAAHGNLANHQPTMFEQILRMANPHLAEILVDSHPGLAAKLLAQNALAAPFALAKRIQFERMLMATG